jgi:hypothetical protein
VLDVVSKDRMFDGCLEFSVCERRLICEGVRSEGFVMCDVFGFVKKFRRL